MSDKEITPEALEELRLAAEAYAKYHQDEYKESRGIIVDSFTEGDSESE